MLCGMEKNERIQELEALIKRHQNLYYNAEPEISDADFDALTLAIPCLQRYLRTAQMAFLRRNILSRWGAKKRRQILKVFKNGRKRCLSPIFWCNIN